MSKKMNKIRNLKTVSQLLHFRCRSISYLPLMKRHYSICLDSLKLLTASDQYFAGQSSDTFLYKSKNIFYDQYKNICTNHALYAKEKKKVPKEKLTKIKLDLREMNEHLNVDQILMDMKKALDTLRNDFIKNLTLRTTIGSVEEIIVEFEGKQYELQELVQIARKSNLVVINADAFPQTIPQILVAIEKCGMNVNPQQDGTKIAIPLPKVTKEHREILSKNAKSLFIRCRDNIKEVRNKYLKKLEDEPDFNKDTFFRIKVNLDILCEQQIHEAENMLKSKQAELLGS